jgi:hypothetical protein
MKFGAIRSIRWDESSKTALREPVQSLAAAPTRSVARIFEAVEPSPVARAAQLDPTPASAEEEAQALLRIAAEVEGALMVQYLFTSDSLLPGIMVNVAGFDHSITSDDWYDTIRLISKQEMGHLITVQNLLLSLDAAPHVDRENFPWHGSELYPFPFSLQQLDTAVLAKTVCAEAPREIAPADRADYADAMQRAGAVVGHVSRVGQIYERLYWLFQDSDAAQSPGDQLQNPFPQWPNWHVTVDRVGFNQDRQANETEWRASPPDDTPDTAVYVLPIRDKASARAAIFKISLQGEGPVGDGITHFDKFLRIFREHRAVDRQAGAPAFARNQAPDPRTGLSGLTATITDATALAWARLGNTRYQMLLMDIALSLSVGQTGTLPSTTARRSDFTAWAFSEMLRHIKPISAELRNMPLKAGASPNDPRAGFPFELPDQNLSVQVPDQLNYLRRLLADCRQLRATIQGGLNPTPKQQGILNAMDNLDKAVSQKVGVAEAGAH